MTDDTPVLYVMVGLPAAGKSTLARQQVKASRCRGRSCSRVCRDELAEMLDGGFEERNRDLVRHLEFEAVDGLIKLGSDAVLDRTSLTREGREKWLEYEGVILAAVVVVVTEQLARERNARRPQAQRVPDARVDRMAGLFELPTLEEGFDVVTVLTVDHAPPEEHRDEHRLWRVVQRSVREDLVDADDQQVIFTTTGGTLLLAGAEAILDGPWLRPEVATAPRDVTPERLAELKAIQDRIYGPDDGDAVEVNDSLDIANDDYELETYPREELPRDVQDALDDFQRKVSGTGEGQVFSCPTGCGGEARRQGDEMVCPRCCTVSPLPSGGSD